MMNGLILVYALLVFSGGIFGYLKARSKVSLFSGVGSGLALAGAWYVSLQSPQWGLALAAVLALLLTGVFWQRFRKTQKLMPAGLLALVSGVAALGFAIGWWSLRGS